MLPDDSALVPAMRCANCDRLVPRTGVKHPKGDRRQLNIALRAHKRKQIRERP